MKELYTTMEDLLEIEYRQEAFIQILCKLEEAYDQQAEQKNMKMLVSIAKWQIEEYNIELRKIIEQLDTYIAKNAACNRKKNN